MPAPPTKQPTLYRTTYKKQTKKINKENKIRQNTNGFNLLNNEGTFGLSQHCQNNILLIFYQCGFRKRNSCIDYSHLSGTPYSGCIEKKESSFNSFFYSIGYKRKLAKMVV